MILRLSPRTWTLGLVLAALPLACGEGETGAGAAPAASLAGPTAARPKPLPREAIAARFPGMSVAIAAQVSRGDRQAAIVWPAFRAGAVAGDAVVAVAFQRQGLRWRPIGEVVPLSRSGGKAALRALMGGDDFVVDRRCGVEADALADFIRAQIDAFAAAVRVSDTAKAITAYEELTRGFSFELIAYDDLLGEWLFADASGVPMTIDMEPGENGEWLAIEVRMGDRTERARLPLVRCSEGFTLGAPME
ncbi:MAG: hypothetical protein H6710_23290 [Myxococcales bacterium]|nr:hypothetical protein [Myxococcales bacterium]